MDYKYIEQLLDKYWQCETSQAEELILRVFFSQESVPAELSQYQSLFKYEKESSEMQVLGVGFDKKILQRLKEEECGSGSKNQAKVKVRVVSVKDRMMPLLKAVAVVAVIVVLGNAAQFPFQDTDSYGEDINYANYQDTYSDPSVAYDKVESALLLISEGISKIKVSVEDTLASVDISKVNDSTGIE